MGGLIKAPKPVAIVASEPPPVAVASPPDQAATQARAASTARARSGLAGTIATSARGVLEPAPVAPRKSLLGE